MINLIGKRLLDFIIVGGIVFGMSYGLWAVGNRIVDKPRKEQNLWENTIKKDLDNLFTNPERIKEIIAMGKEKEYLNEHAKQNRGWILVSAKLVDRVEKAERWNLYLRVASILVALLGVISTIGIVFRPKELSQRAAFVSIWKSIPKYTIGYFKSDKKDI